MLLCPFYLLAQTAIDGKVLSQSDQTPLPGVSVTVKGEKNGVSTNVDGIFRIKARKGDVLVFSGVGTKPKEVQLSDLGSIVVTMDQISKDLDEVVVTALGIKKESKRIGYSIQEVKADDMLKAREADPMNNLVGKVAGLNIGINQELLASPTVLLRGNPLTFYVVDGIPISSDTYNISPDDIETFSILKGPAAAALYGNRGIYGAILITTKHGAKNRKGWTVEVNSSNQRNKGFIAIPKVQNQYGPGDYDKYAFKDGLGGGLNDADYDIWGPALNGALIPQWNGPVNLGQSYTTTFADGSVETGDIKPTPFLSVGKNNMQHFLRAGVLTTNNINLSSVTDRSNVRMSVTQTYQGGIVPNTEVNKLNYNLYGSYDITSKLKVEGNVNYDRQFTPNTPDITYGPNSVVYAIDVWTGSDWNIDDPAIKNYWPAGTSPTAGVRPTFIEYKHYQNPWFTAQQWLHGHYKNDLYGYLNLNYKIGGGFEVQLRSNVTMYDLLRTEKLPWWAHPYSNEYNNHGNYREDHRDLWENNTEFIAKYSGNLGGGFNLFAIAGATARNFKYNSSYVTTDQLITPDVFNFDNSLYPIQASNFASNMLVLSAYASADLTYKKYFTLSASGREDKSSALPVNHNAYFYPSASISTVISDYAKMPNGISFLKVRANYANVKDGGTQAYIGMTPTYPNTGNSPGGGYPLDYGTNYQSVYGGPAYTTATPYTYSIGYNNNPQAASPTQLVNPNLVPQTYSNYEGGLDIRFLKNRLGASATYFEYVRGPLQYNTSIAESSGYNTYLTNAEKTQKTGEELSIQGTPIQSRNLRWEVLLNWSTYKETYKSLPPDFTDANGYQLHAGDRADLLTSQVEARNPSGQVINDASGLPVYLPIAQPIGHGDPNWTWGINNKFAYKNFSLSFQFDGQVGGKIQDLVYQKLMEGGRGLATVTGVLGEARAYEAAHYGDPGYNGVYINGKAILATGVQIANGGALAFDQQGHITNGKDLTYQTNNSTPLWVQQYSSGPLSDAEHTTTTKTYAKLREVVLGYSLPASFLRKSSISNVSLSLVGRNLLYFFNKKFKDIDVDQYPGRDQYGNANLEYDFQSPTTRSYGFNVNVTF
jgi:TonB-linked SusC/RagA family outer membrane protein